MRVNPFRAPKPLPILNPSNNVPQNGFPVVKGLKVQVGLHRENFPREDLRLSYRRSPFQNILFFFRVHGSKTSVELPHDFCLRPLLHLGIPRQEKKKKS